MTIRPFWLLFVAITAQSPAWALSVEDTRHLLDRTGFGARPEMIDVFAPLDRGAAAERVLAARAAPPLLPEWADERPFPDPKRFAGLSEEESLTARRAEKKITNERRVALKVWWFQQMLDGDALTERMMLFWHNHFTSQLRTVGRPQLMLRQHQLLRRHALGNYADLLRAVATDPAMLIYLDGRNNQKARPNENFARELLELFALGEGHYGEADIQSAARAFSGWRLDPVSGTARFDPRRHDDDEKTFLGQTGHWGVDGIVAILLEQPRAAEWIVEKLWVELISPKPDEAEVARLASVFRDKGYEMRPVLRELLLSDAFWADENRGTLIKSPIELIVGTLWRFELPIQPAPRWLAVARGMGQDLLDPPDVRGWPGQTDWIDGDRLLARERFLNSVIRDLDDETAQADRAWAVLDSATTIRLLWAVPGLPVVPTAEPPPPDPVPMGTPPPGQTGTRVALVKAILDPRYQVK